MIGTSDEITDILGQRRSAWLRSKFLGFWKINMFFDLIITIRDNIRIRRVRKNKLPLKDSFECFEWSASKTFLFLMRGSPLFIPLRVSLAFTLIVSFSKDNFFCYGELLKNRSKVFIIPDFNVFLFSFPLFALQVWAPFFLALAKLFLRKR